MTAVGAGVSIQVSAHLAVSDEDWSGLRFPEQPGGVDYLRAIAETVKDSEFHYFLAWRDGRLIGAAYGFLFRYPVIGPLRVPLFVGGSPVNVGSPFYFVSPEAAVDALPGLLEAMAATASRLRAALLVVRDLWEPDEHAVGGPELLRRGFRRVPMYVDALLPLTWTDFDGYLASLPSARRKDMRRDARRFTRDGYRVEVASTPLGRTTVATMHALWRALYEKYRDRDQVWLTEDYFDRVSALPQSTVLLALRDDELIGFDLLLRRGEVLESVYSGVDQGRVGGTPVHRHLGHEIIRLAIERGLGAVDFGISNEDAKARMGCELRVARAYVRPLSRLARLLRLGRLVFPDQAL
ncbi:GNAT family N-acetyltransferase [Solihabitans fulvus]|nr:GNAT family N-acetyltransferase [Solihabitans fulvus]